MQNGPVAKGRILHGKRPPFTRSKAAFWEPRHDLLQNNGKSVVQDMESGHQHIRISNEIYTSQPPQKTAQHGRNK